jgi:hypothetical protein
MFTFDIEQIFFEDMTYRRVGNPIEGWLQKRSWRKIINMKTTRKANCWRTSRGCYWLLCVVILPVM